MPGQRLGSFIAAVFGLVYAWVNSAPLLSPGVWLVRGTAAVTFLIIVLAVAPRARDRAPRPPAEPGGRGPAVYSQGFWLVTAVEAIGLFGGLWVLANVFHRPEAGVAWVSVVVGVHFLPLGKLFRQRFFLVLGAAIGTCGVVGLLLAAAGAPTAATSAVAGVAPGTLLLAAGWWGTRRDRALSPTAAGRVR